MQCERSGRGCCDTLFEERPIYTDGHLLGHLGLYIELHLTGSSACKYSQTTRNRRLLYE